MRVEFIRFCVVGTLGFLIDSSVTLLMIQIIQFNLISSRIVAFIVASVLTWYFNRRYTFRSSAPNASWLPYIAFTSLGALINIGIYNVYINLFGASSKEIVLGVACGSGAALLFNFLVSRYVIFRTR